MTTRTPIYCVIEIRDDHYIATCCLFTKLTDALELACRIATRLCRDTAMSWKTEADQAEAIDAAKLTLVKHWFYCDDDDKCWSVQIRKQDDPAQEDVERDHLGDEIATEIPPVPDALVKHWFYDVPAIEPDPIFDAAWEERDFDDDFDGDFDYDALIDGK